VLRLASATIRARLVLLVLAVWLPAVAGLALQARDAYLREEQSARERLRQQATALTYAAEAELDRRELLARGLAASPSLRARDIDAFAREARQALAGTPHAVLLVDREWQAINTLVADREPRRRGPGALFVEQGVGVYFTPSAPATGKPRTVVLVPEATQPPHYNVGVTFPPAAVQQILERQQFPEGGVAAVLDSQQRLMARSRDPDKWIGQKASHPDLRALSERRGSGFVNTRTLDGVPSLTFLAPPNRYGWAGLVALPVSTLQGAAWRLALQAIAASALLLVIGLGVAAWAARRVSSPVRALERAANELFAKRVPEPLYTGMAEVDRVGTVLRNAGLRAREAEQVLEARVNEAIAETRKAEANLFDARKHEAIGRLTGGVAHDFNNLLQTISMGLQVVQRAVPEGRHTRPLQSALSACNKAADLVRQMLAFGRAQQLHPQPVDLPNLLLRSRELTAKALGERVRLIADLDPALPSVLADPTQLELALLNVIFNARDAMPGGGTVTVRAWTVDGRDEGLDDAAFVRIDVQDTGTGMDAETLARVFEPYFTTKPVGSGSGLGLPQVQAFARQSGGNVRITSDPGQGTCVTMLLPVAHGVAAPEAPAAAPAARKHRPLRVLMVEDDILVASVVPAALEHEGHRVTLCRTADDARVLLAQGAPVDVLFTDVVMPGSMTGLELVAWCRENRPEVPGLLATGYSARTPEGAWKVLRKPYSIEDLLDALDAAALQGEPA
jgi:signal transduction histidine kinase/CheY-like chemotaxis protein